MTQSTTTTSTAIASLPALLLRLEGAALFVVSLLAYAWLGASGWLLLLLILAPDLSMIGYARDTTTGARLYNLIHTSALPLILGAVAVFIGETQTLLPLALIWLAHIGMDRMVGYGLKYPTGFKDTHLGRV